MLSNFNEITNWCSASKEVLFAQAIRVPLDICMNQILLTNSQLNRNYTHSFNLRDANLFSFFSVVTGKRLILLHSMSEQDSVLSALFRPENTGH